jgi:2-(1,2-epoxy-1,2-dihydrophenyl)acetyl-CoA isomerase
MNPSATLLFERDGSIAKLTLNRPDLGNAIDLSLAKGLMKAAISCDEDDSIGCVVLTGAGRFFCTGGDVGEFVSAGDAVPSLLKELTAYLHMAIARLARMQKPLITAINGPAAGAGLSLAVLGDIALSARSAHFTPAYTGIGLSPDGGSTWLLPRLVGLRRAQEIVLTNKRLGADDAAELGLVTRAVDDELLAEEVRAIVAQLGKSTTAAIGRTRNLLLSSLESSFETQMEDEARAIAELSRTSQTRDRIQAFVSRHNASVSHRESTV